MLHSSARIRDRRTRPPPQFRCMPASVSSQPSSPARLAPEVALLLLAMLLSLQPISTDLYLPALPTLTAALGSTIAGAQLTLGVLSLAFGVAQMLCGPLADRYGRRPVLDGGLWLYVGASLASALAPNITWLVVARGVQGAAMAAGVVGARAMLRDLYDCRRRRGGRCRLARDDVRDRGVCRRRAVARRHALS